MRPLLRRAHEPLAAGWRELGPGRPRREFSAEHWQKPLRWNVAAAKAGARPRVFPSICDPFDNEVPPAWRAEFFELIAATPHLDWLLLTKRIGNAWKMMADASGVSMASLKLPLANVWLGATVVNQAEADRDIPKLLQVPARVRFLSIEPMLGPINLPLTRCDNGSLPGPCGVGGVMCPDCGGALGGCQRLHWIICGGESGPGARPMHPDWARSLRDQCAAAGVPFLFKQWGEYAPPADRRTKYPGRVWREFPPEGGAARKVHFVGDRAAEDYTLTLKLSKTAAGRLLDGVQHDGVPNA